jgi:hypothetical protein
MSATTAGGSTTRLASWWVSPTVRRGAVDVAAVSVLLATGVLAFGPVFGGYVGYLAAGTGAAAGVTLGVVSAVRSWTRLGTLLAGMIAFLLLGGAVALPGTTVAGVLPTLDTLQRLVVLSWQAWRDLLTVSLPAGEFDGPAVLPFLVGLVSGTIAISCALRLKRAQWAVLPALVFLAVGILWGSHQAPLAVAQGAVFAGTTLAWTAWRTQIGDPRSQAVFVNPTRVRVSRARQAGLGVAVLLLATVAGAGLVAAASVGDDRHVLRDDVVPPLDLRDYASPLTLFRSLETAPRSTTLFTVSELPASARIRLAALDLYDGNVYNVSESSATFGRAGSTIVPSAYSDQDRTVERVSIEIGDYAGVWLPGGGDLRGVTFDGPGADREASGLYFNPATGTALTTAGLAAGSRYDVDVALPPTYDAEDREAAAEAVPGSIALPADTVTIDAVPSAASDLVGDVSRPLAQLTAMESTMKADGAYANGTVDESLAGHTAERIRLLLASPTGQMVGDDEQYAVAMTLMARQLGLPARVVMGFYPDPDAPRTAPLAITGEDAHVWVEVLFDRLGWVSFDPTPDRDQRPDQNQPQPQERSDPQVLPPPEVPEEHDPNPPAKADSDQTDREVDEDTELPAWVRYAGLGAGGAVLLSLPFLAVALLKSRRRTRRRRAPRIADRISGGWAELADTASDLGIRIPAHATRPEAAQTLADSFPGVHLEEVARKVDAEVFGFHDPDQTAAESVWTEVDQKRDQLLRSVNRRRRLRSRFSLRSVVHPSDRVARRSRIVVPSMVSAHGGES